MATIDLCLFKKHVRVEFDADDDYLIHLLDTAEEAIVSKTNRDKADLVNEDGRLPKMLQQAALMLAAPWYNQPESAIGGQMTEVPESIAALTKPFRRLV